MVECLAGRSSTKTIVHWVTAITLLETYVLQITFQLVISRSLCRLQLMGPCHSRRRTSEVATQTSRLLPLRKAVKEICRLLRKRQWWAAAGRDPRIPKSLWSLIGLQLKRRAVLFQHLERVKGVLRYKA